MREVEGIWLPDGDTHFPEMLAKSARLWKRPTYQVDKFLSCLSYIKKFHHAVDVGAHCGLWSMVMVHCFRKLTAFEPIPEHAACWRKNVKGWNAVLHETAVGDRADGKLRMKRVQENSGLSHVDSKGEVAVPTVALDAITYLDPVDFLKVDCEGYEYFALKGAEKTILRDKPCILVEEGPPDRYDFRGEMKATDLLMSWGAELRFSMGPDHCLSWS